MSNWTSETWDGIHAFTGGEKSKSTVVLMAGWPETADAFSEVFPLLKEHHRTFCLDLPGIGNSAPSAAGYDTGTLAKTLQGSLQSRINGSYHLVGHDLGAWIAYAWAAQFPDQVKSLTVIEGGPPGLWSRLFPLSPEENIGLWQFAFNRLPDLPEILTAGRERELFDWLFQHKAAHPERISKEHRKRYLECYAKPGAMSRGFAYYRDMPRSASQNLEFSKRKLPMPILALGGDRGMGGMLKQLMEKVGDSVEGGAINDCGHFAIEEQPHVLAGALLEFLKRAEHLRPGKAISFAVGAFKEGR
jgi:pimeloyl-ACP methyl ester carboxylesterase